MNGFKEFMAMISVASALIEGRTNEFVLSKDGEKNLFLEFLILTDVDYVLTSFSKVGMFIGLCSVFGRINFARVCKFGRDNMINDH